MIYNDGTASLLPTSICHRMSFLTKNQGLWFSFLPQTRPNSYPWYFLFVVCLKLRSLFTTLLLEHNLSYVSLGTQKPEDIT